MLCTILKNLRIRSSYTQQELGKILGVGKSTISMYETGARVPDYEMLKKMADVFGVDINVLFGNAVEDKTATPSISKEAAALIETLSNLPSDRADFANRVLELVNLILQVSADKYPLLEDLLRVYLKNL